MTIFTANAGIAQLVEQLICNQQVVGSNPSAGSPQLPKKNRPKFFVLLAFDGVC